MHPEIPRGENSNVHDGTFCCLLSTGQVYPPQLLTFSPNLAEGPAIPSEHTVADAKQPADIVNLVSICNLHTCTTQYHLRSENDNRK